MYKFKTLEDYDFKNKKVLLRLDINLPFDSKKNILNDRRIRESLKTVNYLLDKNVKLIVATHFGRPKGNIVEELRVDKIAERFSEILGKPIKKLDGILGKEVEQAISNMNFGDIIMLENIQFEPGEIENSDEYSKELASYVDIFVLDAFGQAHRNYASISGIQKFIPSCAGFIIQKEIDNLSKTIKLPEKPFYAIIGGVKPGKIGVIKSFINIADKFLIGGVLANTFLKASGINIGLSKFNEETLEFAKDILNDNYDEIILPEDVVVSDKFDNNSDFEAVNIRNISKEKIILDIGSKTIEKYKNVLSDAKTIVWAGTMGVFEFSNFSKGTKEIADFIANSKAITIIGGGDTVSAVENLGLNDKMTHVSTGGGASLEFLSGNELPGIKALEENVLKFNSTL